MSRKAGTIPEETKMKLLESAVAEFAQHGFQKASLRRICANAGVTTGALYFFFQDKEDLFQSVISPVTDSLLSVLQAHYQAELAGTVTQATDASADIQAGADILEVYYSNKTIGSIILNHRDHPAICAFFDQITTLIDQQTISLLKKVKDPAASCGVFDPRGIRQMQEKNIPALGSLLAGINIDASADPVFNDCTVHWISHLQIDAVMHIIGHDYDENKAKEQLEIMVHFLRAGFLSLLSENLKE